MRQHVCVSPLKSFLALPCYLCSRAAGIPAVQSVSTAKTPTKTERRQTELSVPGPAGKTQNQYTEGVVAWLSVWGDVFAKGCESRIFAKAVSQETKYLLSILENHHCFLICAHKMPLYRKLSNFLLQPRSKPDYPRQMRGLVPPLVTRLWIILFSLALSDNCGETPIQIQIWRFFYGAVLCISKNQSEPGMRYELSGIPLVSTHLTQS